ncbi:MAG: ClC family H(+)/Cl(-) exchange transporter [Bacillota bacterium]|nr:ClC family H(+)/Cl(-) exchange transporter [Bacillota bacterium]
MKKDIPGTLKRADRFPVILIGEGVLVGIAAGAVVLLYRIALEYAGKWLNVILEYASQSPLYIAGWFVVLMIMALVVRWLVGFERMISGSGIPQLKGEMTGRVEQKWYRVIPAKFAGGFLCMLGGLALGREGPSIQIGAMAGKGISKWLDRGKTEEKFLLTCGASAGLAAAFHAPLAGVLFSMEEIHRNFSASVLLSVATASLTADCLCTVILGEASVFRFDIIHELPMSHYGLIVLLGVILGVLGAFYNWFTLKVQELYDKLPSRAGSFKIMIPFLCAGILGFTAPELLGSGHSLVEYLTNTEVALGTILFILVGRFVFSAISFGSGAPGGIFFPLLVLGGFIGGAFAAACSDFFGLDPIYINNFVLLAMAGYFSAIVRAPLTGIVLIFEMTGNLNHMLSLSIVSIVAYIVASLMKSRPIYESLLDRLLAKQGKNPSQTSLREKILTSFVVGYGSRSDGSTVSEVEWPENCLLVSIQRGADEIIPKGRTKLQAGDVIVIMMDERDTAYVHEKMRMLCEL